MCTGISSLAGLRKVEALSERSIEIIKLSWGLSFFAWMKKLSSTILFYPGVKTCIIRKYYKESYKIVLEMKIKQC